MIEDLDIDELEEVYDWLGYEDDTDEVDEGVGTFTSKNVNTKKRKFYKKTYADLRKTKQKRKKLNRLNKQKRRAYYKRNKQKIKRYQKRRNKFIAIGRHKVKIRKKA